MALLMMAAAACQPRTEAAGPATPAIARADSAPDRPADGEATTHPPAKPPAASLTHWQCDDILLDLHEEGSAARIDFSGRSLTLQHGESLVGARYSDQRGNAFTREGGHATLDLPGGESHDCTLSNTGTGPPRA